MSRSPRSIQSLLLAACCFPALLVAQAGDEGIVPVRYSEGTVHGFLELRGEHDSLLARGEMFQVPGDSTLVSTMRFFFRDGSRFEETTEFSQHQRFRMRDYHLVQRGPSFPMDIDATLNRTGRYEVTSAEHGEARSEHLAGHVDLRADIANGLPSVIAKNLKAGDSVTVQMVAFTPKPMVIGLRISYEGVDSIQLAGHREAVTRWDLSPDLGALKGFFAKLLGKLPPDTHLWITSDGAPGVVRVLGPLYTGPVWQIDLSGVDWKK